MSRVISIRDLQKVPILSHLAERDFLKIENDELVNSVLQFLGFNINAAILYVPSNHRSLDNKTGVGFRAVGEITQDRTYLRSSMCPTIERLIAAAQIDPSLVRELAKLMTTSTRVLTDEDTAEDENFPNELIEESFDEITHQIQILTMYRDHVRGDPYNEAGALKNAKEYAAG